MRTVIDQYLKRLKQNKNMQYSFWSIAVCLSFVVILGVFWYLKLTGVTLAGEAFCGMEEHAHGEDCTTEVLICELEESEEHIHGEDCYSLDVLCDREEHIHIESCYSDITADLETADDWEMSFADAERGSTTAENMVILATSQLGYRESELNFEVDANGVRRGITRYGQWYGNPTATGLQCLFRSVCIMRA